MDVDQLKSLASVVVTWIRPNEHDIETVEDCWQTAYLAGLQALRNTEAKSIRPSERYLMLCMQSAVYRTLKKPMVACYDEPPEIKDNHDIFMQVDARDFINSHISRLLPAEARTLKAFCNGDSCNEIAEREGITYKGIYRRITVALRKLKAADDE